MIKKIKYLSIFLAVLMFFTSCTLNLGKNATKNKASGSSYAEILSSDKLLDIQIDISDNVWNDMITNAEKKEYHSCNVTINGETLENVGIRTKGSASLETASETGSDRYSFILNFNKYVKGQNYHGMHKLALNNNSGDNTQIKDAVTYDMCRYLNLPASLYNYAKISKNGEYFGCYLVLEPVDKDFCKRNYNSADGALYSICEFVKNDGGNLNYIDDKISTYTGIFEEEKFGSSEQKQKDIIKAVKNVCENKDIEKYVDIDSVLKFLAVQTVVVNLDSITGSASHNTMLYTLNGKIYLIPWDNNLAFGGYIDEGEEIDDSEEYEDIDWENVSEEEFDESQGEDYEVDYKAVADNYINFPIDTPFNTDMENRKFFKTILENKEYLQKYHQYLDDLAVNYIQGGQIKKTIDNIDLKIGDLVGTEANAFVTCDAYKKAVTEFIKMLDRKALAIQGQLKGELPSTKEEQLRNTDKVIKYDDIDMALMGGD